MLRRRKLQKLPSECNPQTSWASGTPYRKTRATNMKSNRWQNLDILKVYKLVASYNQTIILSVYWCPVQEFIHNHISSSMSAVWDRMVSLFIKRSKDAPFFNTNRVNLVIETPKQQELHRSILFCVNVGNISSAIIFCGVLMQPTFSLAWFFFKKNERV